MTAFLQQFHTHNCTVMAVPIGGDDGRPNKPAHPVQSQQNSSSSASHLTTKSRLNHKSRRLPARFSSTSRSGFFWVGFTPTTVHYVPLLRPKGANWKSLIPTLRRHAGSFPFISLAPGALISVHGLGGKFCELEKPAIYNAQMALSQGFSDSGHWPHGSMSTRI